MEAAIKKPSFRQSSGKANEVNYWIFDYPPEKELEVRERIEYMKNKNQKGTDEYQLVVFDLYDIIIDFLERKNFIDKCYDFEKQRGFGRIVKAVSNSMKVSENDSLVVQYIQEHTPENAIVFLTGVGKCYPLLRSHNVLNNLHQSYLRAPVVMFFPGTYNEQELILFNEIKDDILSNSWITAWLSTLYCSREINLRLIPLPYAHRDSHTEPFLVIVIRCSTSLSVSGRGPYAMLPDVSWNF